MLFCPEKYLFCQSQYIQFVYVSWTCLCLPVFSLTMQGVHMVIHIFFSCISEATWIHCGEVSSTVICLKHCVVLFWTNVSQNYTVQYLMHFLHTIQHFEMQYPSLLSWAVFFCWFGMEWPILQYMQCILHGFIFADSKKYWFGGCMWWLPLYDGNHLYLL